MNPPNIHTHTQKGEMIDRIEHNVENAAVHVDRGRKEIRTAVQYQKKNRRVSNCTLSACLCAHPAPPPPILT